MNQGSLWLARNLLSWNTKVHGALVSLAIAWE
jgi:hypothetical protein